MPAPSNDAYTAAPVLFSQIVDPTGSLDVDSTGATPDAALSEAEDIHSVWYQCYLVTRTRVFITTRVYGVDALPDRTSFNTVLTLYAPAATPTTVVASSDDYAHWEREAHIHLPYGISVTGYYWLRVHGVAGSEGKFRLRWDYAPKRILTRKCHVRKTDGLIYVAGARLPAETGPSSTNFTNEVYGDDHPEGQYCVRYANGTFRFGDTTVPNPGTLVDWVATRKSSYQFLYVGHINPTTGLPTQTPLRGPNHAGAATSRAAEDAALFIQDSVSGPTFRSNRMFTHGGGAITLDFVDDQYTDNLPGDPLPGFVLYRVVPHFDLVLPPTFGSVSKFGDTDVVFTLRNTGHNAFIDVKVELELLGLVDPITPSPAFVTFNTTSLATTALSPFDYSFFDEDDEGRTQFTARLKVSDSYGELVQTFDVDLTPKLEAREAVVVEDTGSHTWLATFPIFNAGYGPTRQLVATLTPIGMDSPSALDFTIGVIQPRATYDLEIGFTAPLGQPFKATFGLVDGPLTHPSLTYAGTAREPEV